MITYGKKPADVQTPFKVTALLNSSIAVTSLDQYSGESAVQRDKTKTFSAREANMGFATSLAVILIRLIDGLWKILLILSVLLKMLAKATEKPIQIN